LPTKSFQMVGGTCTAFSSNRLNSNPRTFDFRLLNL
jgi:hypothetical protein